MESDPEEAKFAIIFGSRVDSPTIHSKMTTKQKQLLSDIQECLTAALHTLKADVKRNHKMKASHYLLNWLYLL